MRTAEPEAWSGATPEGSDPPNVAWRKGSRTLRAFVALLAQVGPMVCAGFIVGRAGAGSGYPSLYPIQESHASLPAAS